MWGKFQIFNQFIIAQEVAFLITSLLFLSLYLSSSTITGEVANEKLHIIATYTH